jgi:hypothetical protein
MFILLYKETNNTIDTLKYCLIPAKEAYTYVLGYQFSKI